MGMYEMIGYASIILASGLGIGAIFWGISEIISSLPFTINKEN